MKIFKYIIGVLLILFLIISFFYINKDTTNEVILEEKTVFEEMGFSKEEENFLNTALSKENLDLVRGGKYSKDAILSITKDNYYIDEYLSRYLEIAKIDSDSRNVVKTVNTNSDKDDYVDVVESDLSNGILMIGNKHYVFPDTFLGLDLVNVSGIYSRYNSSFYLNSETFDAFLKMDSDAKALGLHFTIYSGYRSFSTQQAIYNRYVKSEGEELADTYSARPGSSEHQTGLTFDLYSNTLNNMEFGDSSEYKWLVDNAHLYGFIIRYELGEEAFTGYQFEPWHYRYVGVDAATYIYEHDITFEEYYEYFVK